MTYTLATRSGNPNGRPRKKQALTEILKRAGNKKVGLASGEKVARKRLVAELLWDLVTLGKVYLDGQELAVSDAREWLQAINMLYERIDGPARAEIDVNLGGAVGVVHIAGFDAMLRKVYTDAD